MHKKFIYMSLKLAQKARGLTSPNPLVGAVVVKSGKVIGQGYHKRAGSLHAEVVALNQAGRAAKGATLYVNLEPCCHFGRTAPCVDKIITSQIKEVVFAIYDPNPLTHQKAASILRKSGIKVISGILENEARQINKVFIKYITKKMPFVSLKVAQSLDGKIASATGDSKWITSTTSRKLVHKLRSQVDAVLVGVDTALLDNPLLTSRLNGKRNTKQPKRIIVDSKLRLKSNLRVFSSHGTIIATTKFAPPKRVAYFRKKADVLIVKDKRQRVDLPSLLRELAKREISHVLVEGGGEIIASFLTEKLVDEMFIFIAPKIVGGRSAPTAVEGSGIKRINRALKLKDMRVRQIDSDLIIQGKPK